MLICLRRRILILHGFFLYYLCWCLLVRTACLSRLISAERGGILEMKTTCLACLISWDIDVLALYRQKTLVTTYPCSKQYSKKCRFFSTPVLMHSGLICIALHPSVHDWTKIQTRIIRISLSLQLDYGTGGWAHTNAKLRHFFYYWMAYYILS